MNNLNELLSKEYWMQYLELAAEGGLTDGAIANDIVAGIEKAINYSQCCVNKDIDKHPIKGVNKTMQVDTEIEEMQLCGKSNCNRQKLDGNVYCSYHYDINFG